MTSSRTRELGMRCFIPGGTSCIRFLASSPEFFIAHGRGLFSRRAVDNIESLIPFLRQPSKPALPRIAKHSEQLPSTGRAADLHQAELAADARRPGMPQL